MRPNTATRFPIGLCSILTLYFIMILLVTTSSSQLITGQQGLGQGSSPSPTATSHPELEIPPINPGFVVGTGCWEGTTSRPNWYRWLNVPGGCGKPIFTAPTTLDLCIRRIEVAPGYEITYRSTTSPWPNFEARTRLIPAGTHERHIRFRTDFTYRNPAVAGGVWTCGCDLTGDVAVTCGCDDKRFCNGHRWFNANFSMKMHPN
jgi:hypothetical protein